MSQSTLKVLGSSDAFNSGGYGNSCYWVADHLGCYMVDCGPTAPLKCQHLKIPLDRLDVIYLTHLHGDHITGIPGLLIELNFIQRRTKPLLIAGPQGTEKRMELLYQATYPSLLTVNLQFEVIYQEWDFNETVIVADRVVQTIEALHDPNAKPCSIAINNDQQTFVFSGDTGWNDQLIELCKNADLFVCECSYEFNVFGGHLSLEEIMQYRDKLECKQLLLTHFDHEARQAALKVATHYQFIVAEDGLEILFKHL